MAAARTSHGTGSSPGDREPSPAGTRLSSMRGAQRVAIGVAVAALIAGCTAPSAPTAVRPVVSSQSPPGVSAPPSPASSGADCPPVMRTGGYVSIDYVDFIRYQGRDHVSGLDPQTRRPLTESQLGAVVLHVRCSLSELNDRTGKTPARRRDGDAAFLRAGTPVYAMRGWSPRCRLAARHGGRIYLYLAYRKGGTHAAPVRCALTR